MNRIFHISYFFLILQASFTFAQKSNIISVIDSSYTDTEKDLIRYISTVVVEISPNINPYRFILKVHEIDTTSFQRVTKNSISIYDNSTDILLQEIKDVHSNKFITLGYIEDYFPDINFDGYADLPIVTGTGYRGLPFVEFWLFQPGNNIFSYDVNYANLFNVWVDNDAMTFTINKETGHDKTVQEKYTVIDNVPKCIYRTVYTTEYDENGTEIEIIEEYKVTSNDTIKVKESRNK